jgi:hypothetical protein
VNAPPACSNAPESPWAGPIEQKLAHATHLGLNLVDQLPVQQQSLNKPVNLPRMSKTIISKRRIYFKAGLASLFEKVLA